MKTPRKVSPARSQGPALTPRLRTPKMKARRTFSVGSARSNASGRLTAVIQAHRNMDSFVLSPLINRKSILSDNTEIGEPRRKSWYKKLGENTRDVIEVLEENKIVDPNNIIDELDIEVLSQEKKNYTMDLPESSDGESINSIVIPQRKLFTQKENVMQNKFGEIISTRETLAKLHKPNTTATDKTIKAAPRELFQNRPSLKPIFPAALLNISPNKTVADKTKDFAAVEPKSQVRNIFGNRAKKRKNIFCNFIVSESEDEIPDILQPKVFKFQNKNETCRRGSSSSHGMRDPSPTSSITVDIEMEDWKMLPSSTMVENQLEIMMDNGQTPKICRLSKLTEDKESETGTSSKDSDKSRKSKTFIKEKVPRLDKSSTRNKSYFTQVDDNIPQIACENSRKSKTFIKDKVFESEMSMTTRNQSKVSQDEILQISNNKSHKSKTFTKEKVPEPENQVTQNKSKSIMADLNISQSSIRTRSEVNKSQNASHNALKVIDENTEIIPASDAAEHGSDDEELNFTLKYESENIDEVNQPYNDSHHSRKNEEISASKSRSFQSTSQKDKIASNTNKSNISLLSKKVTKESAELKSSMEKSHSVKGRNESQVNNTSKELGAGKIINDKNRNTYKELGTDQTDDVLNSSNFNKEYEANEMDVDGNISVEQNSLENINEEVADNEGNETDNEEIAEETIKESEVQNEIEGKTEKHGSRGNTEDENNDHEDMEEQNKSNEEKESNEPEEAENQINLGEDDREVDNESDNKEIEPSASKNRREEAENQIYEEAANNGENEDGIEGHKISEEITNDERNESQEAHNKTEEDPENEQDENQSQEQNESFEEENEEDMQNDSANQNTDMEQAEETDNQENEVEDSDNDYRSYISPVDVDVETNEETDNSEDAMDSDNGNEPNTSQDNVDNASDHQNENQVESGLDNQEESEEAETRNVSHDTTGRNRKKNDSPEVILQDTPNHNDSFAFQVRKASVRETEMIKSLNIRQSLAPVRSSTGLSDGTNNSSAEGSGWDSHRTTRKTLRQTFGKDFTTRKSLRTLVMEKSAKRQTEMNDAASITAQLPQANSTEFPDKQYDDDIEVHENEPNPEVSLRTRQTTLEMYLQSIKMKNTENRLKMEEAVISSLNAPSKGHIFKVPAKPMFPRRSNKTQPKKAKPSLFLGELPAEVIEDMKYKPPKRFQPSNAAWITKRLYKFLETKLEPKYDYKARLRAEKLVEHMYHFAKDVRRHDVASTDAVDVLKREMARLTIVNTHFEFYEFIHQFMPREVRVKVIPDVVNRLPLPRRGIFADIL